MNLTTEQQTKINELLMTTYGRLNNLPLLAHRGGTIELSDEFKAEIEHAKAELNAIKNAIGKPLVVGAIVKRGEGWLRIKSLWGSGEKQTANLAAVFDSKIYEKRVPVSELVEDGEGFHEYWSQSETYKSM